MNYLYQLVSDALSRRRHPPSCQLPSDDDEEDLDSCLMNDISSFSDALSFNKKGEEKEDNPSVLSASAPPPLPSSSHHISSELRF